MVDTVHPMDGGISYEEFGHYSYGWETAFRLKDASTLTEGNNGGDIHELGGGIIDTISGFINKVVGFFGELLGEDEEFPTVGNEPDKKNFYYQGVATLSDVKEVNSEDDDESIWNFLSISKVIDWLISSIFLGIRGVFVGWANIIQVAASIYVANISGEPTSLSFDTELLKNFSQQMKDSLTIEKIVYNQVPVFDINVFTDTAAGKSIKTDSLTDLVRKLTAGWYYSTRTVSIIALLIVLIYVGVKAAFSTIAEDKAQFKEMLKHWLVAFIVVFCLHYFILFILQMNESIVKILAGIGKPLNLYEQVRELTWSPKVSTGFMAAVLYITLVWYLLKFIVIYFKRLFIAILLIIIGPLVGAKYAYDKIKGNMSNKGKDVSLSIWIKEFTFNVFIQSIQALIYTIFISIILKMSMNNEGFLFSALLLAFLFFRFMEDGEKILRNIFNLTSA